jgi:hypothetical protein
MKNKKILVWTVQKSKRKIVEREVKSILLTHQYNTAHFPGIVQALQKVAALK